jgi:hypothetical protein
MQSLHDSAVSVFLGDIGELYHSVNREKPEVVGQRLKRGLMLTHGRKTVKSKF